MRKKVILLFVLCRVLIFVTMSPALAKESNDSEFCSTDLEERTDKRVGDYRIKVFYAHERMCQHLEVFKQGESVFHEEGFDTHYSLGSDWNGHHKPSIMHMTGNGVQLIVSKWTGAAHCCMSLLVFDLGGEFRKIAEIEGGNFDPEIVDIDHDGIPEIRITDDFLAYRFSSFGSSAQGMVILKYLNGKYVLAEEMMRRPPPSGESLRRKIPAWRKALRRHDPDWPPEPFIQALTDLVFTGNADKASGFVDRVWPDDLPGKDRFLKSYKEALSESRYFSKATERFR